VALDNNAQANVMVHSLSPSSAIHSINGDVLSKVDTADNQYASMGPGETISLSFAVPAMEGEVRDFVLQTKGYYIPVEHTLYPLGMGVPGLKETDGPFWDQAIKDTALT